MADLPSLSQPNPTPQPTSRPTSLQAQPVRIHFPGRFLATRTHGDSSRSSSISFASPTQPAMQSRSDNKASGDMAEVRRRIRSLETDPIVSGNKLSKSSSFRHHGSRRKKYPNQSQSSTLPPVKGSFTPDFEPNAFSDEYDLSHEDPKILQDVQRALYLQSRRRERMSQQPHHMSDEVPRATDSPPNTNAPYASASVHSPSPHSSPRRLLMGNLPAEVDFRPSTRSVPLHPIPLSSNGGATLDWTGLQSGDEKLDRRWSISRGKRKAKEGTPVSSKPIFEKQEALFTDRISRIRAEASPSTVRKAAIVSEQLGRRYSMLYASVASGDPVSLGQVARWHAGLGMETQAWLDSAEPLTWLKHLDRRGKERSQWHVSALIMEEYVKFKKGIASFAPLPRSPVASSFETSRSQYHLQHGGGQVLVPPADSSPHASLSRIRSSDGPTSLGSFVAESHDSLRNLQTRGKEVARGWRHSIPTSLDSSIIGGNPSPYQLRNSSGGFLPIGSRPSHFNAIRPYPAESEEGSSSPFGSQSEDQGESSPSGPRKRKYRSKRLSHLGELRSLQEPAEEIVRLADAPNVQALAPLPFPADSPLVPNYLVQEVLISPEVDNTLAYSTPLRRKHSYRSTSLSVTQNIPPMLTQAEGEPEEDDRLEKEYELKSKALEELKNQNHRLRHRMQRIAIDVRECDLVCFNVLPALGVAYRNLPIELLDALSHDPSAVTSGTRKRRGWRIVEDINTRVVRQREIVANFLAEAKSEIDTSSTPESVLDQPITALMEKLQALEKEREPLQERADEVLQMLTEVRASHSAVKDEYNDALSYTSVVYPELSQIVALEESYKDQYQQVWELGLDALTVILDTIAPFWRSYGKIIGEDMQDFIIIPWYRNEFTGESKRYAIRSVPRRSLRHWFALFCLVALTFFVAFLQARAAITSAWHYRLVWIDNQAFRWAIMPFFWMVILIQWLALIFEICVSLLHVAVVAWWLGWFIGICT